MDLLGSGGWIASDFSKEALHCDVKACLPSLHLQSSDPVGHLCFGFYGQWSEVPKVDPTLLVCLLEGLLDPFMLMGGGLEKAPRNVPLTPLLCLEFHSDIQKSLNLAPGPAASG